jgi:hypothetical protein
MKSHCQLIWWMLLPICVASVNRFNSTFSDISGGGIKLGYSGERGVTQPQNNESMSPEQQDRGFIVSDNLFAGIPVEYSGANPIFAAYVADTSIDHNSIHDSTYSGICLGWGWGMSSYMRNVNATSNSILRPMQKLADGGGLYTNAPCPGCHVSRNYFEGDPTVYGCLYHDGGSGLWSDYDNVFNHIKTSSVFCHGGSGGIIVDGIFMNDSGKPNLQGATNMKLANEEGVCTTATIETLASDQRWSGTAAEVVAQAGRRTRDSLPELTTLVAPTLSPPVNDSADSEYAANTCTRFGALPCVPGKRSQAWMLSPGHTAGDDSRPTSLRSATSVPANESCWTVDNCGWGGPVEVIVQGTQPTPTVCKALPPSGWLPNASAHGSCMGSFPQAFLLRKNGTIGLAMRPNSCLQVGGMHLGNDDQRVYLTDCDNWPAPPPPSPPSPPPPPSPFPPPGPAPPPSKNCVFIANTDYKNGGMGGAVPSNSTEQCCAECLATKGCKFGVWMNNGGLLQCYLKDASAVGSGYTHAGRYSCAPKAAAAPNVALEVAESTVTAKGATEASQKWEYVKNPDGSLTIRQGGLCITNNLAF